MSSLFPTLLFDSSTLGDPDHRHAQDTNERRKLDRSLCCVRCSQPLTTLDSACEILGQHQHRYRNPLGRLFEFQTYRTAPGCIVTGEPTLEYSWFSGYYWQYASCRQCHFHLGWYFFTGVKSNGKSNTGINNNSSGENDFFGLIKGQVQPCHSIKPT